MTGEGVTLDWLARPGRTYRVSRRDQLEQAIHPSRYVRGSDILDIFGE